MQGSEEGGSLLQGSEEHSTYGRMGKRAAYCRVVPWVIPMQGNEGGQPISA